MRQLRRALAALAVVATCAFGQTFTNTVGAMTAARSNAAGVLLNDGTVLIAGGTDNQGNPLAAAEVFDPTTSTFHAVGNMSSARGNGVFGALLPSGKVLVVGGGASTTDIYDPASGSFSPGPPLPSKLSAPTGLGLADGRVWVMGDDTTCTAQYGCPAAVAIYDEAKNAFVLGGDLQYERAQAGLAVLKNGDVLVAFGWGDNPGTSPLDSAEIYDPTALTARASANPPIGGGVSSPAMTTLPNGQALISGGNSHAGGVATAWLYDPAADTFTLTAGPMATPRIGAQSFLLHDGTVLVAGGNWSTAANQNPPGPPASDAEIYNPQLGTFSSAGNFNTARPGFTGVELQDGTVLLAGGGTNSAEVFTTAVAVSPDFSLSADQDQVIVSSGSAATFKISASGAGGFSSSIDLACSGNGGVTCAFSPAAIAPGATSTLTVNGIDLTGPPTVKFNVVGTSGTLSHTLGLEINVEPPIAAVTPTSLSFGNQNVGSGSPGQTVSLDNNGAGTLDIANISATGDFSETNNCPASIPNAGGQACTITVIFTPTAGGARSGQLVITDNAPFSPQTVALSGTGVAPSPPAAPVAQLSPASLTFASTTVGATTSAQAISLSNTGNANLTGVAIASSGDFAQTNNCGATVAAGKSCEIQVTFTPTAAGDRSGQITVSDDAADSPQTAALAGTGAAAAPASVGFSAMPGSSNSASVPAGQTASYQLSLAANGSLPGPVTLACTGAPAGASCAASPATVAVGTTATNVTVSVTTTAGSEIPWLWMGLGLLGLAVFEVVLDARQRRVMWVAGAAVILAACGGAVSSQTPPPPPPPNGGTPAGTYTLTVTATAGGATVGSDTLTLTVK